jgi:hypothetical protein
MKMNQPKSLILIFLAFLTAASPSIGSSWDYTDRTESERLKPITTSLSETDIIRLLNDSSKIGSNKRIAISTIAESNSQDRSYYYPRKSASEIEFRWITDSIVKSEIATIPGADWIKPLPSTLIPSGSGFDHYREAAAKLRANILLLYKIDASIYENTKAFSKNTVMAIATIEFISLNVATGTISASEVVSKKVKIQQQDDESSESMLNRAKAMVIIEGLKEGIHRIKPQL